MATKAESIPDKIPFSEFYPAGEDIGEERRMKCFYPDHKDDTPSMFVNMDTGQYYCHGCGRKGNAVTYARDILKLSYEELAKRYGLTKWLDPAKMRAYHDTLMRNDRIINYLQVERGLNLEVLRRFVIGLDGERITIPIAEEGEVVNVRRYLPKAAKGTDKMRNEPGYGAARLWPQSVLSTSQEIVVCEGEMDCLCLLSHDIPAVTGTGGASTWRPEWAPLFAGKDVTVCYDIDKAGSEGAAAVVKSLLPYAGSLVQVHLPLDPQQFPTGDVTDYFVNCNYTPTDFRNLIRSAEPLKAPDPEQQRDANTQVFDVPLASASKAQYYNRRIRSDVIVSAKDTAPYFVPRRMIVTCSMGMKICAICPVQRTNGTLEVTLREDDPLLLSLINRGAEQQKGELKRHIGIPRACGSHAIEVAESHNIEEIRLVPQFDSAVTPEMRNEYVVRRSFLVGHGIETNASFRITALTIPEPNTQYATHLIYHAQPSIDSLSDFKLDEHQIKELHQIFGIQGSPSADRIWAALMRRYDDLEANVTHIWGRRLAHLLCDITAHSVLYLDVLGDLHKGYVESLLIGDSGQGKSAILLALQRHYGLGERVDTGAATVAGLKGGLQETQKRWWVTWGIIPQNDRRWVILEEVKNANPEVLAKLRDMRSSGIAEVAGIERQRTNARCRLLWVSNPRGRRQLGAYDYGVQAVLELMGHLEDVRRFDAALGLSSGEVGSSIVNRTPESWPQVEHKCTPLLSRRLLLFAWSRGVKDVHITREALGRALDAASRLGERYHPSIPLIEGADQRLKLLRVAAAISALTFCTEDGQTLEVLPPHVEVAERFLTDCFNSPALGYDMYSKQQYDESSLHDPDVLLDYFQRQHHPWDLVRGFLQTSYLSKTDISEFAGIEDKKLLDEFVGVLVRKRALKKYNTQYRKSPAFIEWLRALKPEQLKRKGPPPPAAGTDLFGY